MPHSHARPLLGRPVTITGLGTYVPEKVVTNDDLAAHLDTSGLKITLPNGGPAFTSTNTPATQP